MPDLDSIYLYRMTHINNVPHILSHGITHKNSEHANPDFKSIGDTSLIDHRRTRTVSIDNGGTVDFATTTITLGDFIPFYFGTRMPMLYVIQQGGNFVQSATSRADIVYIACSLKKLIDSEINFYFSDGHATDRYSSFYDKQHVSDLPNLIDWDAVKAPFWSGQENLNTKRKKQAEFLVEGDVPAELIFGIACYNEEAKKSLVQMGFDESKIKVVPKAYY